MPTLGFRVCQNRLLLLPIMAPSRTWSFSQSEMPHHPYFPLSPASVISFPQMLLSESLSSGVLTYLQFFHVLHFFFCRPQNEIYTWTQFYLPISLSFPSMATSLLLSKRKPLCAQKKRAPLLMLDIKLPWYQLSVRKQPYQCSHIVSVHLYSDVWKGDNNGGIPILPGLGEYYCFVLCVTTLRF